MVIVIEKITKLLKKEICTSGFYLTFKNFQDPAPKCIQMVYVELSILVSFIYLTKAGIYTKKLTSIF